jgi:hypothetical protein
MDDHRQEFIRADERDRRPRPEAVLSRRVMQQKKGGSLAPAASTARLSSASSGTRRPRLAMRRSTGTTR